VAVAAAAETLAQHNKQADAQEADEFIALESTDELLANKEAADKERAAAVEALEAAESAVPDIVVDSLDRVPAQYREAIRAGQVHGLSEENYLAKAQAAAKQDVVEQAQHRVRGADNALAAADGALAAARQRNSQTVKKFQDRKDGKAAALVDEARGALAEEDWTPLSQVQQRRERYHAAAKRRIAANQAEVSKRRDLRNTESELETALKWFNRPLAWATGKLATLTATVELNQIEWQNAVQNKKYAAAQVQK